MHKFKPGDRVLVSNKDGTKEIARIVARLGDYNGEPYYTIDTRTLPVPESVLEPVLEPDDDLITVFDEDEEEIEEIVVTAHYYYNIGDLVRIDGYGDRNFVIIERHTEISEIADLDEPCVVVYYRVVPEGEEPGAFNTLVAFEEDVDLVRRGSRDEVPKFREPSPEEISEKLREGFANLAAEVRERKMEKEKDKRPAHRREEKRKLAALAANREMIARARARIDDYLDLYRLFRDEKYLRKIERLTKFIDRVPCRAYEIE